MQRQKISRGSYVVSNLEKACISHLKDRSKLRFRIETVANIRFYYNDTIKDDVIAIYYVFLYQQYRGKGLFRGMIASLIENDKIRKIAILAVSTDNMVKSLSGMSDKYEFMEHGGDAIWVKDGPHCDCHESGELKSFSI